MISSKTRRYSFKMGKETARRKRRFCQASRISNGAPYQKIPETMTFSIEDRLDRHFERRLTLAIADFKSAFFIPAFLASARA
jgi:hypothetical protein